MKDTEVARPQAGPSQTLMVRRAAFDRVGAFDPTLRHRDAHDWLVRARAAGLQFGQVDEVLVRRRLHANNLSRSRGIGDAEDLFAILRKKLAARGDALGAELAPMTSTSPTHGSRCFASIVPEQRRPDCSVPCSGTVRRRAHGGRRGRNRRRPAQVLRE